MIKKLSSTEVEKFHGQLAQKMIADLRKSDSINKDVDTSKIEWAYSYETMDDTSDIRQDRLALDRKIRAAKLMQLDSKLGGGVARGTGGKFLSFLDRKEERKNVLTESLENYFAKIITISLMIKIGDYERRQVVEKTSLFESKIREEMGKLKF
jgi:hypothetical protein